MDLAEPAVEAAVLPEEDVDDDAGAIGFPEDMLPFDMEDLRPGRDGRAEDIALKRPLALRRGGAALGCGSGGAMHGDRRYSFQVLMSKKSTGYSSLVYLLMKHLPFNGNKAKDVRMVKLTCAVRTREEMSTSSPFRSGPRILTHP